jgi:PAS domain S-box-containing protein
MDNHWLLQRLVEQSCDLAILFLDLSGRIIGWGGGAAYVFGYEAAEIVGRPSAMLFIPGDREAGLDRHEIEVARNTGSAEDDRWMQRKDGSKFWATGVLTAIRDEAGEVAGFAKVLRNRTDLKEQIEGLRARVIELDQSGRRKDVFISTLSHELRGPLARGERKVLHGRMYLFPGDRDEGLRRYRADFEH